MSKTVSVHLPRRSGGSQMTPHLHRFRSKYGEDRPDRGTMRREPFVCEVCGLEERDRFAVAGYQWALDDMAGVRG